WHKRFSLAYFNRGNARFEESDTDGAIADYSLAIKSAPRYAMAFNSRGLALLKKGNLDDAILDFSKAIRLMPKHPGLYANRGIAHFLQNEADEAERDFARSLSLKPDMCAVIQKRIAQFKQSKASIRNDRDVLSCSRLPADGSGALQRIR